MDTKSRNHHAQLTEFLNSKIAKINAARTERQTSLTCPENSAAPEHLTSLRPKYFISLSQVHQYQMKQLVCNHTANKELPEIPALPCCSNHFSLLVKEAYKNIDFDP